MNRTVLTKGLQLIGLLFTAFGGFLAGVAPPQAADARFAVGLSSFLALIVLFVISAVAKSKRKTPWLSTAGVFLGLSIFSGFYYWSNLTNLTYPYPPANTVADHIAGTEMTDRARKYQAEHPGVSKSQLVAKFGGLENVSQVWPDTSIERARTKLIASYVFLVLSVAVAIFVLTEGALFQANQNGPLDVTEPKQPLGAGSRVAAVEQPTTPPQR
jgi:uncharacterized membrane protein YhhN